MNKKKMLLGGGILAIAIIAMALIWTNFREKPVEGMKEISITVVNSKDESEVYEVKTDAEFLAEAMDDAKEKGLSYKGEEGPYGLTVIEVNGERAVYEEEGTYWSFYVNGEYCNYGISEQPVENGDAFKIVYAKAE